MITKIDSDLYQVETIDGSINIELAFSDLHKRLMASGVWTMDQIDHLKSFDIGESTPPVRAYYYLKDGKYFSDKGVIGKKI